MDGNRGKFNFILSPGTVGNKVRDCSRRRLTDQNFRRSENPPRAPPKRGTGLRGFKISAFRFLLFPYGTWRVRQKLFVLGLGVFVKMIAPLNAAGFVICGTQVTGGVRLKVRSSA